MTLRPVDRWEWIDLIRRARLGRTTKAVAVMLATYANEDGSKVFPGIARLAVVCEIAYNTVKGCLAELRENGWIERVSRAGERGRADVYRLTVSDEADVPNPALTELEIERIRGFKGGRATRPRPTALAEVAEGPRPAALAEVVDNREEPRPTARAEVADSEEGTSAHGTGRGEGTSARLTKDLGPPHVPPHVHVPEPLTPTSHDNALVAGNETSARGAAVEDPISMNGDGGSSILRLVADIPEEPRSATGVGNGFCVPCYRAGQVVVAADPVNGSTCNHHLASLETA